MSGSHGILRGVTSRDLRDTLRTLEGEGWELSRTGGGHIKLVHEEAEKPIFSSMTPSDFRAPKNLVSECGAALREAKMRRNRAFQPIGLHAGDASPLAMAAGLPPLRKNKPRWDNARKQEREDMFDAQLTSAAQEPVAPEFPAPAPVAADVQAPALPAAKAKAPAVKAPRTAPKSGIAPRQTVTGGNGVETVDLPAGVLDLALRIARGEVSVLRVTADMVGSMILHEGPVTIVRETGLQAPAPSVQAAMPDAAALSAQPCGRDRLRKEMHDVLRNFPEEWLSRQDILNLIDTDRIFNSKASLRTTADRLLTEFRDTGLVDFRQREEAPRSMEYRMKRT